MPPFYWRTVTKRRRGSRRGRADAARKFMVTITADTSEMAEHLDRALGHVRSLGHRLDRQRRRRRRAELATAAVAGLVAGLVTSWLARRR